MKFYCNDKFWARVPYISFDTFIDEISNTENPDIRTLIEKNEFKENLLVSSRDLYKNVEQGNYNKQVSESCLKYLMRSSTRCTPYGLNAAIIRGKLSDEESLILENKFRKIARPDIEWLSKVISKCEKIIGIHLLVKVNNTLEINEFTVEKLWNSYYSNSESGLNGKVIINNTGAVRKIFHICQKYVSINEIINFLKDNYPEKQEKYLYNFIQTLLNKEFLVSDLRPCLLVQDQFNYLISKLKNYEIENSLFNQLNELLEQIICYNNEPVGEVIERYNSIVEFMSYIESCSNYLSIDMYQPITLHYEEKNIRVLEDFADFITSWGYVETYNEYTSAFLGKYGQVAVKYVDLIDSEIGLGIPKPDGKVSMVFKDKLNESLISYLNQKNNIDTIDLSFFDDPELDKRDEKISLELTVFPFDDNGDEKFLVAPMIGSPDIDKVEGRFKYIFEDEKAIVSEIESNIVDVEITFPPFLARHANVQLTSTNCNYILEYGTASEDGLYKRINLDDIYVFIDDNRKIQFIDKQTKKLLNFKLSNTYNQLFVPKILKPLLQISSNQHNSIFSIITELKHIIIGIKGYVPRIIYKTIVIYPASWKLNNNFKDRNGKIISYDKFLTLFKKLKVETNIPDLIYIGPHDQRMILNTSLNSHLEILYSLFKDDLTLLMYEMLWNKDNLKLYKNDKPYLSEFVFSLTNKIRNEVKPIDINDSLFTSFSEQSKNSFMPFDKWISMKFYLRKSMNEIFLIDKLDTFINELCKNNTLNNFFYIRYMDPHEHIRFRIKTNKDWNVLLELILHFITLLRTENIITNCVFDTYEQEYLRYGGRENIELAEKVFESDSVLCINLLKMKRSNILDLPIFDIYIISSVKLLNDLRLSIDEQLEYLSDFKLSKADNEKFRNYVTKTNLQELINDCDRWDSLRSYDRGIKLLTTLQERSYSLYEYWYSISKSQITKFEMKTIVNGLLHMHFNRLIGIDRELENRAIAYLRKLLFNKSQKDKYNEKNTI